MNFFAQLGLASLSSFFSHAFTLPHAVREKLVQNPEAVSLANHLKQVALTEVVGAINTHVQDPLLAQALALETAIRLERAIPTPAPAAPEPLPETQVTHINTPLPVPPPQ